MTCKYCSLIVLYFVGLEQLEDKSAVHALVDDISHHATKQEAQTSKGKHPSNLQTQKR